MTAGVEAQRQELLRRLLHGTGQERIPQVGRGGPLPLSHAQQRLWFLDRLRPGTAEYLVTCSWELTGPLDADALTTALGDIVARHEILRTRYPAVDDAPVQVIDEPAPVDLVRLDLSGRTGEARDEWLAAVVDREATTPFDLAADRALRATLAKLSERQHVLILALHHIAIDGWSIGLLGRELATAYQAAVDGRASAPAPDVQYADFACWQRESTSDDQLAYWRGQLEGSTPTALRPDLARPVVPDPRGELVRFTLPAGLSDAVSRAATERGLTPYMLLLAAFQLLIGRYAGSTDVVVGTPVAGRPRPEVQDLIGLFVNTLVLRTDLGGDPTVGELLARVRRTCLDAYAHQELPFDRLVGELGVERDLSGNPLTRLMFVLNPLRDNAFPMTEGPAGLKAAERPMSWQSAKSDLTLSIDQHADGTLSGVVEYMTALFDRATAERIAAGYERVLRFLVSDPGHRIGALDLLGAAERRLVLAGGPDPEPSEFPSLPGAFEAIVRRHPDRTAVERLSYGELNARANRLARHLRSLGAGTGTAVAVCLERGPGLIAALLAVLKAGAFYVPLDPSQPDNRNAYIADDSGAKILISQGDLASGLPAAELVLLDDPALAGHDASDLDLPVTGDNLAYLIYTSGSTGRPKGVAVTHGNVLWLMSAAAGFGFGSSDVWTLFHSYAFDFSVWELWGALLHGGRLVVVPAGIARSPGDFARLVREEKVTVLNQTPSAFRGLCEAMGADTGSLRTVVFGGEALRPADLKAWFDRYGTTGPVMTNMYGITETTVHVTSARIGPDDLAPRPGTPIGRALPGARVYVLDERLEPVPVGVAGEIYVAGGGLARGYHRRPGLTAGRFLPDPFTSVPGQRMYRSGDVGRWTTGGGLEFLGRADDQVKIRGHRIELGEVEAALVRHTGATAALALVRDDRLVGYLTGTTASTGELRRQLAPHLPDYMIPSVFLTLQCFPLTPSGKVDHRALPGPNGHRPELVVRYAAPTTDLERSVAQVWAEAIGVDRVGRHDRFFDLGGDSLRAVRVVGRLRRTGLDVTVQDLFLHQTVAELVQATGSGQRAAEAARPERFGLLTPADRARMPDGLADAYPLSLAQAGIAYEMLAGRERRTYINTMSYRIRDDGPFDWPALRAAAESLVERHEMLRTSIDLTTYSTPVQLVHHSAPLRLGRRDLTGVTPAEQDRVLRAFLEHEAEGEYDLAEPSLLRMFVHRLGPDSWRVSLTYSHVILDGWSQNSLIAELVGRYRAIRAGGPASTPPPAARFADAVALELRSLSGEADRSFWATVVADREPIGVPPAWGDPDAEHRFREVDVEFADLEPALRALAVSSGVPVKSVLLAAHLVALATVTGRHTASHTGLVCNGRPELAEADQICGMFLNTVPFAVDLTAADWPDLFRSVFAAETALWPHRHYPLPAMHREWGRPDAGLVDVFFNHTDMHMLDAGVIDGIMDHTPNEFGLSVSTEPGRFRLEASTTRVAEPHLRLLARTYRHVLERLVADPAARPADTRLPDADRARLLRQASTNPPAANTFPAMFAAQVLRTPDAPALVCEGVSTTYAELDARAAELASKLRGLGVGRGSRVGVLLDRGPDLLVALLAVLRAGGAYVPLDPGYPDDRIGYMLADAGADLVLTQPSMRDRTAVRTIFADDDLVAGPPGPPPDPGDLAYVIYTSGSTGRPKGVMITHRGLADFLADMLRRPGLAPGVTVAALTTVSFDPSVLELFLPLLNGGRVALASTEETRDPLRMIDLIERTGADVVQSTPVTLRLLLDSGWAPAPGCMILCGGEKLQPDLAGRLTAGGARLWDLYGPTETTVWTTSSRWAASDWDTKAPVYLLDGRLEPVPAGVPGEVYLGGSGLAWGYANQPATTAAAFLPDPHGDEPGRRLYRTGDLALRHGDGTLELLGRADHQVKIRGHRIEPGEIEGALRTHPGVGSVVVHAVALASGDRELVAYLVPEADSAPAADELREHVLRTLPDYMAPAAFVTLPALPVTATGKVDRRALPVPEFGTGHAHVSPRTPLERQVAGAWAEVLDVDRVGVHDNFFDVGGHSVLAIRIAMRLRDGTGIDVPVRAMFDNPTVAALATALDGYPRLARPALTRRPRASTHQGER